MISDVDGRQRLDLKDLPAVRWGQRLSLIIATSPVPAASAGADVLRLDAWVEPARNEPGGCDAPVGCPLSDARANNFNRFDTRIAPPGGAPGGARAPSRRGLATRLRH